MSYVLSTEMMSPVPKAGKKPESGIKDRIRTISELCLTGIFLAGLLWPFAWSGRQSQIFVDETPFISAGNAAIRMLRHLDFENPAWTENDWADWGWPNPMIAKYLIGLALHLGGNGEREFKTVWKEGESITPEILFQARLPGVLLGWGCCILLFLIGRRTSLSLAFGMALYAALNSYFVYNTSLAMLEAPVAFFSLLSILLLLRLNDRLASARSVRETAGPALATGAALGLALGSKYNAGILFLFAIAYFVLRTLVHLKRMDSRRRIFLSAVPMVLVSSGLTFWTLNPQFYHHPAERVFTTLRHWSARQAQQQKDSPEIALRTLGERVDFSARALLAEATSKRFLSPLYYDLVFHNPRIKATFEEKYVNGPWSLELVSLALAFVGVGIKRGRLGFKKAPSVAEILLLWTLFTWIIFMAWIPVNYGRMLIPVFITTPFLVCYGPWSLWRLFRPCTNSPRSLPSSGHSSS